MSEPTFCKKCTSGHCEECPIIGCDCDCFLSDDEKIAIARKALEQVKVEDLHLLSEYCAGLVENALAYLIPSHVTPVVSLEEAVSDE